MTKLVREAIAVLQDMSEDRQETVARAIINFAGEDDTLQMGEDDMAEVERRVAAPNRNFLSIDEFDENIRHLRA